MKNIISKKYDINREEKRVRISKTYDKTIFDEIGVSCPDVTIELVNHLNRVGEGYMYDLPCSPTFTGTAQCDEYDTFDPKVGIEIASTKADLKYHKAMARKYALTLAALKRAVSEIEPLMVKHEQKVKNIADDLARCYANKPE
jgi:hypothetical protein